MIELDTYALSNGLTLGRGHVYSHADANKGRSVNVMFDTGATCSMVDLNILEGELNYECRNPDQEVHGVNASIKVCRFVLKFELGQASADDDWVRCYGGINAHPNLKIDGESGLILGMDYLRYARLEKQPGDGPVRVWLPEEIRT